MDYALVKASQHGLIKVVESLLDKGADIHSGDDCALIEAASRGYTEIVELLLDRGANIHARKNHILGNDKVLVCAASNRHVETVKFLLGRGAIFTDDLINMSYKHDYTSYEDPIDIDLTKHKEIKEVLKYN